MPYTIAEKILLKHHVLIEKYEDLQEHCVSLECNNKNLSKNVTHLLEENKQKQIELINLKERKRPTILINHEEKLHTSLPLKKKRTQSLFIQKKKTSDPSRTHFIKNKDNLSHTTTFIENRTRIISYENDFKEDTQTLLSEMEMSLILKQDTKDLIDDRGYSEYIINERDQLMEKFELMELESPTSPKNKKIFVSISKRNSIKIQNLEEKEFEIKDERKLKRKHEEKIGCFSVVAFSMMVYISFLFKFMRFMRRIAKKVGLS